MASRCRKFTPNLFNKSKCQSCFGAKESHSAEALESSKAARKISKCTYLFVSPDLDFSNPLHRTKRWQRRFFVLYDDGEFTYSVDDNPGTVPQGSVDMNKCTDVFDAEESTGHEYSIGVLVPGTATIYVKGTSKDEIKRWFDVLVMYPRSLTVKNKRSSVGKTGAPLSRNLSYFPQTNDKAISDDEDDVGHSKDTDLDRSGRTRGRFKQRDVRRSKSEVRPSDLKLAEDEYNKKTVDTIKLSLPAPLPADNLVIAAKEKTEDILPSQTRKLAEPETFSSVRSMKQKKNKNVLNNEKQKAEPVASAPIPSVPTSMTTSSINSINSTLESQPFDIPQTVESPVINRRLSTPNITTNGLNHKPVSRTLSTSAKLQESSVPTASAFTFSAVPPTNLPIEANETDEHKIAKSEHAKKSIEKSPTVRKGWLLVRDAVSWSKHWFVLCGTKLSYYKDPKAEETNELDGAIDVASAFEVSSVKTERNHGFKIKTKEGEYILSAMTSGIRRNWVEAVEIIINDKKRASEKSSRQDMGFVYESPRTPRTPAAVGVPALPPILEPVVPDSSSRINNVLREVAERHREVADEPQPESPFSELEMHNPMRNDMECPEECPEVSGLTSTMDQTDGIPSSGKVVPESPQSPKSPSSFVSPSLRIKEKSRSKTPPRVKSPPPPSSLPVSSASSVLSSVSSELSSLIASGGSGSSDENDETLHAKLLDSQKQVQHLQQQLQDSNSSVRKQRVEIESLQTKLDLTTTQLHEMETALTHSAQNLNKERKNVARLNEAFERLKTDNTPNAELLQKYLKLEKQLHEVTSRMSLQEAKVTMMNSLEEQLQQNLMKISTLETMYATAQSQLERTVENLQQTKVHYQKRIEEMESAFGVERAELLDNLQAAEDKLGKSTTVSSNSANSEFTSDSLRDKLKYIKQLEEQLKEQQVMMEQLQEQCTKYINKENFAVDQSNRFTERITLQKDLDQLKLDMRKAAEVHQQEKEELKKTNAVRTQELANSNKQLKEYMDKCKNLENTLKSTSTSLTPSQPTESTGSITLTQLTSVVNSIANSCERMTESAVAMLAGEMIETEIKAILNFNQEQRTLLGIKSIESFQKKFSGVRQRLNYIVKNSTDRKLFESLKLEKGDLEKRLTELEPQLKPNSNTKTAMQPQNSGKSDALCALLEKCRVDVACITADLTRQDLAQTEKKLQELNNTLSQLEVKKPLTLDSSDRAISCLCDKLAVQAAAMFEMARLISGGIDMSEILSSVEHIMNSSSCQITGIEDISLRNFAFLVAERLLLSYELDRLITSGDWKGNFVESNSDYTTRAIVAETLQKLDIFSMAKGSATVESCLSSYLHSLLRQNVKERSTVELLKNEIKFVSSLANETTVICKSCVKNLISEYIRDMVNQDLITLGDVEALLIKLTEKMFAKIKQLVLSSNISQISNEWIFTELTSLCEKMKGLTVKDMPDDLYASILRMSMVEYQLSFSTSLMQSQQPSTLSQSLISEAKKLAGLSSELAKRTAAPGSVEEKIARLAERLDHSDQLIRAYTANYGDSVLQVMQEVVSSLQLILLRQQLKAADSIEIIDRQMMRQIDMLKVQVQTHNNTINKMVTAEDYEKMQMELRNQMEQMKAEHAKELEESKQDMKMVLKSVKAEELRQANDLTQSIHELQNVIDNERRKHQKEILEFTEKLANVVSPEEHKHLKEKVRELESCLHEMQEDFEEDLYQERNNHLAEMEHTRSELIAVLSSVELGGLTVEDIHNQYKTVIQKLMAEQTTLQQWIEEMREAHKDEIDALLHEKDAALSEELAANQAAIDQIRATYIIESQVDKDKIFDLEGKKARLLEAERDLLVQTRDNQSKAQRISNLEEKVSNLIKEIARFELRINTACKASQDLSSQNQRLLEQNCKIIENFSKEIVKLQSGSKITADTQTGLLKSQLENLTEQLKLEKLDKEQLNEKLISLKSSFEQQLIQQEGFKVNAKQEQQTASVEAGYSQNTRAGSPAVHNVKSVSSASSLHPSTSETDSKSGIHLSPRKIADRAYDLSRSKSTPVMDHCELTKITPSDGVFQPTSNPKLLEISKVKEKYLSGGVTLADRRKKFS